MTAPQIAPLADVLHQRAYDAVGLPREWRSQTDRLFVVLDEGEFAGRSWHCGEILQTGASSGTGPVVLVAWGQGRPRLGTVTGRGVLGDCGEPCSGARWRVAGEIRSVLKANAAFARACRGAGARRATPPVASMPVEAVQLSLFERRAA